jgi:hypothetical protein
MKRYLWLLPTGLVLGVIGLIAGLVLRGKNAPQLVECSTKLGEAKQIFSATARATCAAAKSMTTVGNGVMIAGGIVAAITVVLGIAYFVTTQNAKTAT